MLSFNSACAGADAMEASTADKATANPVRDKAENIMSSPQLTNLRSDVCDLRGAICSEMANSKSAE
jgi:hypothetical protein